MAAVGSDRIPKPLLEATLVQNNQWEYFLLCHSQKGVKISATKAELSKIFPIFYFLRPILIRAASSLQKKTELKVVVPGEQTGRE